MLPLLYLLTLLSVPTTVLSGIAYMLPLLHLLTLLSVQQHVPVLLGTAHRPPPSNLLHVFDANFICHTRNASYSIRQHSNVELADMAPCDSYVSLLSCIVICSKTIKDASNCPNGNPSRNVHEISTSTSFDTVDLLAVNCKSLVCDVEVCWSIHCRSSQAEPVCQ